MNWKTGPQCQEDTCIQEAFQATTPPPSSYLSNYTLFSFVFLHTVLQTSIFIETFHLRCHRLQVQFLIYVTGRCSSRREGIYRNCTRDQGKQHENEKDLRIGQCHTSVCPMEASLLVRLIYQVKTLNGDSMVTAIFDALQLHHAIIYMKHTSDIFVLNV